MYRVLIVDDEEIVLDSISDYFKKMNYEVFCARTGKETVKIIESVKLDCVILDIKLPDTDGLSICSHVRTFTSLPIIFLSSYTEEESRVSGLLMGGDDYVCKPFSIPELELRVRARIRGRYIQEPEKVLEFGELSIHPGSRTLTYRGRTEECSRIELDILLFLARHPGETYSYEQLYSEIWKEPLNRSRHNLQARVAELRQKLAVLCPDKDYIQTVWKKGYRFVP